MSKNEESTPRQRATHSRCDDSPYNVAAVSAQLRQRVLFNVVAVEIGEVVLVPLPRKDVQGLLLLGAGDGAGWRQGAVALVSPGAGGSQADAILPG